MSTALAPSANDISFHRLSVHSPPKLTVYKKLNATEMIDCDSNGRRQQLYQGHEADHWVASRLQLLKEDVMTVAWLCCPLTLLQWTVARAGSWDETSWNESGVPWSHWHEGVPALAQWICPSLLKFYPWWTCLEFYRKKNKSKNKSLYLLNELFKFLLSQTNKKHPTALVQMWISIPEPIPHQIKPALASTQY